ncbi:MAG: hypothetical protein HUU47_09270 [Bacteroidetes bacterium]|nr:hypothetical protein [Bacteroidota bacterium]
MKTIRFFKFLLIGFLYCTTGCYTFQGASIPPDVSTFSVSFFENKAATVNPSLSNTVTEKLKDKMNNTRLNFARENGDFNFSGYISEYNVEPISMQGDANTTKNRLKISIQVKFECSKHPEKNFEQQFSNFKDFDANLNFTSIEAQLVKEVTDLIIQEIFNKAAVNW